MKVELKILKLFGTHFFFKEKQILVWTFIFNFVTYLCIFYMWTRSTIQAVNYQATVQVFYLQQNHARLSWPWGARRQNFCCMGMDNRKFSLLSLIKSNFLFILLFYNSSSRWKIVDAHCFTWQGIDYLKYDNCNNGNIKPTIR